MEKLKIFISAYACEPNLGSEIGVGWHWVLEMSKYFELWVLTRKSNQNSIQQWVAERPEYLSIHFLYFDLPKWARSWKKGLRGVRLYYTIWQFCINRIVRKTMQENKIKIFHHLTYGNALWKVSSYGQRQFFIWGPIGGLETIPFEYSKHFDVKFRIIEAVRRSMVKLLFINTGFKKRCMDANLILCKTDITRQLIPVSQRYKAQLFTDVAVKRMEFVNFQKPEKREINFLMVGRLDAWRGFDIVIESFRKAIRSHDTIRLTIVGKGISEAKLRKQIYSFHLQEYIVMTGEVTMSKYYQLLEETDCIINASLKEGAVTVSFDSLAMGKPIICLDTTGYTRCFNNEYAIVIPRGHREVVIEDIKNAILHMTNEDVRRVLGEKAYKVGEHFSWENRGKEIYNVITKTFSSNFNC